MTQSSSSFLGHKSPNIPSINSKRPSFSSSITADRLRESERHPSVPSINPPKNGTGRKSAFVEVGLEDDKISNTTGLSMATKAPSPSANPQQAVDTEIKGTDDAGSRKTKDLKDDGQKAWYSKLKISRPVIKTSSSSPPRSFSSVPRVALIAFLIAVVVPGVRFGSGVANVPGDGADAGMVRKAAVDWRTTDVLPRAKSPTSICTRWSHQSALVNGTLYIYGGQAKSKSDQTTNTWNDNFLTLDLLQSWQIGSPALTGLSQPSGPPPVANGYLWNSYTSLFLYGGEFADNPFNSPVSMSTWEYNLLTSSWIEHAAPLTTSGNNSDPSNVPVQRSAEGAGLSVPELGLSWYFGGHQDLSTTLGWSNQIARIYLKSMLEFTHPSFENDGVQGLGPGGTGAPSGEAYRNITQGGLQAAAGFTERADGTLVYVPGWGTKGILLGLAGGTAETYTEMNIIDIYDIATSTWYKQPTSGTSPSIRVNPCSVVFSAPDFSSFQVYLYGGQTLGEPNTQTQYSDMWILTIPSFTWIKVDLSSQSSPPARVGHTCHAWNGQMVVVGGYVGKEISCDSPGIYVFNASSLQWANGFSALSQVQLQEQQNIVNAGTGLAGSYGYAVPPVIQSVIGGGPYGKATATMPAAGSPTIGPIATGRAPVFTLTQSGTTVYQTTPAGTAVVTATTNPTSGQTFSSSPSDTVGSEPNTGATVAGVFAGVMALIASYLAFCTWLYRRQVAMYKNHVAMSQRAALGFSSSPEGRRYGPGEKGTPVLGAFGTNVSGRNSGGTSHGSGGDGGDGSGGSAALGSRVEQDSFGSAGTGGTGSSGGSDLTKSRQYTRFPSLPSDEMTYQGAGEIAGAEGRSGWERTSMAGSSTEDLLAGQEMSFISVVMSPRRTLRVINQE